MPFIEQQNISALDVNWGGNDATGLAASGGASNQRYGAAPNVTNVTNQRLALLTCPSDTPSVPINPMPNHNYAVNVGNTGNAQQANLNGVVFNGAPFKIAAAANPKKGQALSDIFDGTSNTLCLAEVVQGQGSDLRGFIWWGDATGFTTYLAPNSSAPDVVYDRGYCQNLVNGNPPCSGTPTTTSPSMFGSRSRHTGGVQAVMCDDSVRFIADTIDINVWRALGTSKGNEPVGDF